MLEIKDLSVAYGKKTVLPPLSLALPRGSFTALLGKNGAGKSTLLSAIASLVPYTGKILVGGEDIASLSQNERAKRVSLLPQSLKAPPITVRELVGYGRSPHLSFPYRLDGAERERVEAALEKADMLPLAERLLSTLSGGERARAYIAMTVAQQSPLMLLDEPMASLDLAREGALMRMLSSLAQEGKTVLASMHDPSLALRYADRILILNEDGSRAFFGTREECLAASAIERAFSLSRHTDGDFVFFTHE